MKSTGSRLAFLATFMASAASAQVSGIYVELYHTSNPIDNWAAVPGFPNRHATPTPEPGLTSGSNITINNANVTPCRIFAVSPSNTDIGDVVVNGSNVQTTLFIGTGLTSPTKAAPLSSAGARHIGSIFEGNVRLRLQIRVTGETQETISVYEVVRMDAGTIAGDIDHNSGSLSPAPELGRIVANAASAVDIRAFRGNMDFIDISGDSMAMVLADLGNINTIQIGGDQLGSILAPQGSIFNLLVTGDLGASGDAVVVSARDEIRRISCAQAWADVEVTATSLPNGMFRRLTTTDGDFVGSITATVMESGGGVPSDIFIAGDLDADVMFRQYLAAEFVTIEGVVPGGRTLSLGQGWGFNRTMSFDGGLEGQVILNANNSAAPWSGTITAGTGGGLISLSPTQTQPDLAPFYHRLSSELGGGAVGLAPFNLHGTDCYPPNADSLEFGTTTTVYLRHYGPIYWNAVAEPDPVRIFWREHETTTWIELPAEDFSVTPGADPRDITVTALTEFDFVTGFDYRIIPKADVLKCEDVNAKSRRPRVGVHPVRGVTLRAKAGNHPSVEPAYPPPPSSRR